MRIVVLAGLLNLTLTLPASAQAKVERLEIYPNERVLYAPHNTQQLAVIAHFADGTKRDVTQLTLFISGDPEKATVNLKGLVTFHASAEVVILCRYQTVGYARLTLANEKLGKAWPNPPEVNLIDQLVFAKQKEMGFIPSDLCTDDVFVRRVYLDLSGLLPTAEEARKFLDSPRPDKRARLIEELLQGPDFADTWAQRWANTLDLKFRQKPHLGTAYLKFLRDQIQRNAPLDAMARDIITGKGVATDLGPATFYHDVYDASDAARRVAETFLGIRLYCASCHVHPKGPWTPDDWHGYAAFFSQLRRKNIPVWNGVFQMAVIEPYQEWLHPQTRSPVTPRFPGGVVPKLKPGHDRREAIADWLASPKNPYFARVMVNHLWYDLMGRGMAEPAEAVNEPWVVANDKLLNALAEELIAQRFDAKHLIRVIMNSRTYQLSTEATKPLDEDNRYFGRANRRRLQGAVFFDVIAQFLEVPNEFPGVPAGTRASKVLHVPELNFGPSGPARFSECDAEPIKEHNLASTIHFLNSEPIQQKIKTANNRVGRLLAEKRSDREMLADVYMAAFARLPDEKHQKAAFEHIAKDKDRRKAWEDILWAVINTREFMTRP